MHRRCDVAVVGAGPAGSACALRITQAGYHVALIDARTFPRDKLCGEYVNARAIRELEELGFADLLAQSAAVESIRFSAHDQTADIPLPQRARSIPRVVLDDVLRVRAIECGAIPITGRLHAIGSTESGVNLEVIGGDESHHITARYAVGADGMRSAVARCLNLSMPPSRANFALGAHYSTPPLGTTLEIYVGREGYFALNPSGQGSANVMCVWSGHHLRRHRNDVDQEVKRFSHEVSNGHRALGAMVPHETRRAVGPLTHLTRAVTSGNVLLVGDAAAFVDPFTGQGIFLALAGARLAASALMRALSDGRDRKAAWRSYASDLNALISRRRHLSWLVHALIANPALARGAQFIWRNAPGAFSPLIEAVC